MKKSLRTLVMIIPLTALLFGCTKPDAPVEPVKPTETPVTNPLETPVKPSVETPMAVVFDMVIKDSTEEGYDKEYSMKVDLDGDGTKETVVLKTMIDLNGYGISEYDLFVNEHNSNEEGESINPKFNIVDMNKNDKYLEISVSEEGASSDYQTTFFRYDGKELKTLAKIQGYYGKFPEGDYMGDLIIDGSGTVKTSSRGEILQTWFYDDFYELRDNDEFVHIVKQLYPMITEVTMLRDLKTVKKRENSKEAFILKLGEKAKILETDNKHWVSIKNFKGDIGWFYVDDFYMIYGQDEDLSAIDYFDGLMMAD